MPKKNLIKIVVPGDGDYLSNKAGGTAWKKALRDVDDAFRNELVSQVEEVEREYAAEFSMWKVPGVAVVQLHDLAIAKTKRPAACFNRDTCPIIGYGALGQLLVSVNPKRLTALKQRLQDMRDERGTAHISAIQSIAPYRTSERCSDESKPQRLLLFRHRSQSENFRILQAVRRIVGRNGIKKATYADNIPAFSVMASSDSIATLQTFIGTQSLVTFPVYSVADAVSVSASDDKWECLPPDPEKVYAIVGQFDSGISRDAACIQPWIHARHSWYPDSDQDNVHGTMVGGLLCNAHNFNHKDLRIPNCQSLIVDSVVFDSSGAVAEDVLLDIIDDALAAHPDVRVWNLSLAQPDVLCSSKGFTPLAIALDYRSKLHNVLFVVTGGNLPKTVPPRSWPSDFRYGDNERNCAPSDGIRVLAIGGVAHRETDATITRVGEPSPIVRKGPGGGYNLSPLFAGYPGNCDSKGDCSGVGVRSVDPSGALTESLGISFGIPPISSLAATVEEGIRRGGSANSVVLTKAMLLHAAFVKNAPVNEHLLNYQGIGPTPTLDEVLFCDQHAPTIVFDANFQDRPQLCKRAFPLPMSAVKGQSVRCEILMTLYYDPPLDGMFTFEYVRSNVEAKLGVRDPNTGKFENCIVPHLTFCTPNRFSNEKHLVTSGFKWSPLKLYYADFYAQPDNMLGSLPWELRMRVFRRAEHRQVATPQQAFLFITIRSKDGDALMYDEWIRQMDLSAWETRDLAVDNRVRLTP